MRGLCSVQGGGELGHRDAFSMGLGHVFDFGVIVAGHRNAADPRTRNHRLPMAGCIFFVLALLLFEHGAELLFGIAAIAFHVLAVLGQVAPLALPGGMVHHRHHAQVGPHHVTLKVRQDVSGGHLAAQVQQVLHPQHAVFAALLQGFDGGLLHAVPHATQVAAAHHHRVQHGGDAGSRALCVVHHGGGIRVPHHARARQHVFFQVVGVHLHQAGQQQVTLQIDRAGQRAQARAHVGDEPVAHQHVAQEALVGCHQLGVVEQHLRHELGSGRWGT